MDKLVVIAIIVLLLLLNGLFVAAEFAIVGAARTAIERRADRGERGARRVARILADPRRQDRYIATAQLGITVASLGLGMYGEHQIGLWLERWLAPLEGIPFVAPETVAVVLAVAILTYFHIVIGEMVPKSLALQQPERTALAATPIVLFFQKISLALVVSLNALGNALLRLFGVRRTSHSGEHFRTPEELQYIVRESEAGGMLRRESAEVLQELLEFGELDASEVMVPRVRVVGIPLGASFAEASRIVRDSPHTRYPIYRENLDDIVGMVHIKDLFRRLRNRRDVHLNDARPVPFVPGTTTMDRVLAAMREARTQMAVVMDEHGGTAGIVTVEDLFEEVVGEIEESPVHRAEVTCEPDGRLRVQGTVRLEDVGDALGVVLEHEEVDTVSGLVLALLGRPPALGDAVVYDEVRFTVTRVEGHGVGECLVGSARPAAPVQAQETA